MSSLTEELAEMLANSSDSEDAKALRLRAIQEVEGSGQAPGLTVGEVIPEFVLSDAFGQAVSSGDLLERGPLVISFYRGDWCPYCNLELRALERYAAEIARYDGSIVAISGQRPDSALALTEKHALSFPVLSDLDQVVIRAFKLRYDVPGELRAMFEARGSDMSTRNADGSWTLPISATYVTDRAGKIVLAHAQADWRVRLDPDDIVAALASLDSSSGRQSVSEAEAPR
jgi:peroxiredoxin